MTKHIDDDTRAEKQSRQTREGEVVEEAAEEMTAPTSNDVGEQTETQAGPPPTSAESDATR
jgi:hypothetical protein